MAVIQWVLKSTGANPDSRKIMRNRLAFILTGIMTGVFIFVAAETRSTLNTAPQAGSTVLAAQADAKPSQAECLSCHGPFDKLTSVTDKYTAPSGEKISPHRFVPHDSTKDEDVPECTNCHTAHPLDPLPTHGSVDLSKVDVKWCYETCHHEKNFTSCKQCHA
jgi:hypothetical protein